MNQIALTDLADMLQRNRMSSMLAPMILSVDELLASTDVFPITFMEMQRRYRVLAGDDVLADLPICGDYLRLRCEQELKNLLLRMQSVFLLQSHRPRRLLESLQRSYAAFRRAVRASVMLAGAEAPTEDDQTMRMAATSLSLDHEVLQRVAEACGGDAGIGRNAMADIYSAFLVVVHQAAEAVDGLPNDITVIAVAED